MVRYNFLYSLKRVGHQKWEIKGNWINWSPNLLMFAVFRNAHSLPFCYFSLVQQLTNQLQRSWHGLQASFFMVIILTLQKTGKWCDALHGLKTD